MGNKDFINWILANEYIVKEISNVDPGCIAGYLSEIEGSRNSEAYLAVIFSDLGQNQKFEDMQPAAKYLWLQSRINKLKKIYEKTIRA